MAGDCRSADFCSHGNHNHFADRREHGDGVWRRSFVAVRNGPDVSADGHISFWSVAGTDRQSIEPQEREGNVMKIGVIGIGEMGGTLARRWCAKGHTVRVANSRGTSAAKPFADAIGAEATDIYGAVDGADVVLLAMAFPIAATLPGDLFSQTIATHQIITQMCATPASPRLTAACRKACGPRVSSAAPSSKRLTVLCSMPSPSVECRKARPTGWPSPWRAMILGENPSL